MKYQKTRTNSRIKNNRPERSNSVKSKLQGANNTSLTNKHIGYCMHHNNYVSYYKYNKKKCNTCPHFIKLGR